MQLRRTTAISLFLTLILAISFITPTRSLARHTSRAINTELAETSVLTPSILISALHYYGYESSADEAVQLTNMTPNTITLDSAWSLMDASNHQLNFPATGFALAPGGRIWVANNAAAFTRQFGFAPALAYTDLTGSSLAFANTGGSLQLRFGMGDTLDTANVNGSAWAGGAASPSYASMERIDVGAADAPTNWATAIASITPVAFDASNSPIIGTPRAANSVAILPSPETTRTVVINEVAWAGTASSSSHEWIELFNNAPISMSLEGWTIRIGGSKTLALAGSIAPKGYFLIQRNTATFGSFGNGVVADLTTPFSLVNTGESLALISSANTLMDTLVYGNGEAQAGWIGAPLQAYTVTQLIPITGQILMRKLGEGGLPISNTHTALDWMNDRTDGVEGRKPIYPGWSFETFATPTQASSPITLAVAPDNSFDVVSRTLSTARNTIELESFTFDNAALGDLLMDKARAGVRVRVLLDGAPVGGLSDQTLWICQRISEANPLSGSGCWFLRSDSAQDIHTRYSYLHAKFAIIDQQQLIVSSENFGMNGMPFDNKADGTVGHRGVVAVVSSPELIARASAIFEADSAETNRDIAHWCGACAPYSSPALGFVPVYTTGGVSYTVGFAPLVVDTALSMSLSTSPESHVRSAHSIFSVLNQAGAGDEVLVQELDEPTYWGRSTSAPADDPNVRLQAILDAAARGARIRIALDAFYDDPDAARSNAATVSYLHEMARAHGWDIQAIRADVTGRGIHNKMILVRLGQRHFSQIGSWNGSETSAKRNREMSLLIESKYAHDYLSSMFWADFWHAQPVYMPTLLNGYQSRAITHPLISEVLFNPAGQDEIGREWIEIYNPSASTLSLAGYKIGDASGLTGNLGDGRYIFPANAVLAPFGVMVIAENAALVQQDWGVVPAFELSDYDPAVPQLTLDPSSITGTMNLANAGDEVVLWGPDGSVVDAVTWGTSAFTGTAPFPIGVSVGNHTLQRWPPAQDTDNCAIDFREQSLPTLGLVP